MVAAAVLNFKNVSITILDEDISTKFDGQMHHAQLEMIGLTEIEAGSRIGTKMSMISTIYIYCKCKKYGLDTS